MSSAPPRSVCTRADISCDYCCVVLQAECGELRLSNTKTDTRMHAVLKAHKDACCQGHSALRDTDPMQHCAWPYPSLSVCIHIQDKSCQQVCAECGCILKAMKVPDQDDEQRRLKDSYSVRLCIHKGCNARVNRDVNASRNMLAILRAHAEGRERPPALSRNLAPHECMMGGEKRTVVRGVLQ